MPRIRLVYADGACNVVSLPEGLSEQALEARVGPVIAAVVTECAPGEDGAHTVAVPEIATAVLGAPLETFVATGLLPHHPAATLLLAAAYKAAERLDMKGFVLAVERRAMRAVAEGGVRLDEVAAAFTGCPRVEALCENYLALPGARPPPPTDLAERLPALVREHGALLALGRNRSHTDEFWVLADIQLCLQRSKLPGASRRSVFAEVAKANNAEAGRSRGGVRIFSMIDWEKDMSECAGLQPCDNSTWISEELESEVTTHKTLSSMFSHAIFDLVVGSGGDAIYSRNMLTDFTLANGFERRYGPYRQD